MSPRARGLPAGLMAGLMAVGCTGRPSPAPATTAGVRALASEPDTDAAESAPAPDPDRQPDRPDEPEQFTPATRTSGTCEVTVRAVLEAIEYRGGGPITPALAASLDADPEFARHHNAESHGDHHIQCVYEVTLGHEPDRRYRWRMWFGNTLREHTPRRCNALAAEVAQDILRATRDCSDLDAGAYWGHVLEPLQDP